MGAVATERAQAPGPAPIRARAVAWLRGEPLGVPTHALAVHFPTALLPTSLLLDLLAKAGVVPAQGAAATLLLALGLVGGLVAGVTGLLDWLAMLPGPRRDRVTRHLAVQVAALMAFAGSLALRLVSGNVPLGALFASALGVGLLVVGGHLGGLLVYRDGMRVRTSRR